jgi:hypothetical protein
MVVVQQNIRWPHADYYYEKTMRIAGFAHKVVGWAPCAPIKPGIYVNTRRLHLIDEIGVQPAWTYPLSALRHVDQTLAETRRPFLDTVPALQFRHELPHTDFIEGDLVKSGLRDSFVISVDYLGAGTSQEPRKDCELYLTNEKLTLPPFDRAVDAHRRADQAHVRLVRRGNIWRALHNEPLFGDPNDHLLAWLHMGRFTVLFPEMVASEGLKEIARENIDGWFSQDHDGRSVNRGVRMNDLAMGEILRDACLERQTLKLPQMV